MLYNDVLGGRLAAAIAYYGFFAVFALALVGYSIFGAILEDNDEVSAGRRETSSGRTCRSSTPCRSPTAAARSGWSA